MKCPADKEECDYYHCRDFGECAALESRKNRTVVNNYAAIGEAVTYSVFWIAVAAVTIVYMLK